MPNKQPGIKKPLKLDKLGGIVPSDMARAKHVDLVTLPKNIPGTNCFNCKFVDKAKSFCNHPEVMMAVNERNCCAEWWNDAGLRDYQ